MKLLAGLGNPGRKYVRNRHNVGFMVLDEIARAYNFAPWRSRFQGQTADGHIGTHKCLLLKPETYMNLSGQALGEAVRFYKIDLEDVTVFHDELDIEAGKVKIKTGGGDAGHNGLKSVTSHLGKDYQRVRIGIGHPGNRTKVNKHVLKDFSKPDQKWLEPLLEELSQNAELLLSGQKSDYINAISTRLRQDGTEETKHQASDETKKKDSNKSQTTRPENTSINHETQSNQNLTTKLQDQLKSWLSKSNKDE